jgi:hypothetical protein
MHQPAHQVSTFLRDAQRRWANPPLELLLADGLTAEEADALLGVDGGGSPPLKRLVGFSVRSQMSSMKFTQMRTMPLLTHQG